MAERRIYHITHVDNLQAIAAAGLLYSDASMMQQGGPSVSIGMSKIKTRRLSLPVKSQEGTYVGEYVPFYFCPRSVMLYIIYCENNPDLQFQEGQDFIAHISASVDKVLSWAEKNSRRWAITSANAGARYTRFSSQREHIERLKWDHINATDWGNSKVKESKQSEFLMFGSFPWSLIDEIGVLNHNASSRAHTALEGDPKAQCIRVRPDWYYRSRQVTP